MVKLEALNSRMKDFYDLWLISRQFEFDSEKLSQAIQKTFQHRGTKLPQSVPLFSESIYDKKSVQATLWKTFLKKENIETAPDNLKEVATAIEKFLSLYITNP